MKTNVKKRFFAYLIDMVILVFLIFMISILFPSKDSQIDLKLDNLSEKYLNKEINFNEYIRSYSYISHDLDIQNMKYTFINIAIAIVYFIIIPFILKGQTLGKKIFKIKVVNDKGTINLTNLLVRTLVIDGLGYMLIILILVYFSNGLPYLIATLILSIMQLAVIIVSGILILKSPKHLGIHDFLGHTKVVNL